MADPAPGPAEAATEPGEDAWDTPPRLPSMPVLHLDGFDGPLDLLLELAERQRIDLGRMSVQALAEQFVAALATLAATVPLELRADWLVLATRLVLLRSRLLFPASPAAAAAAAQEAAAALRRLDDLGALRAAAAWLQARPQLGVDVFARPHPAPARQTGYVALLEACLGVLRGRAAAPQAGPAYAPVIPDLWRVADALARIQALLAECPAGGALARFLPPLARDDPAHQQQARAAVASTFLAGLELARDGSLTLDQDKPFATIGFYRGEPTSRPQD